MLSAHVGAVFTNHDARNLVQDRRACAHRARRERGDQRELLPIATTTCVPNAIHFSMRGGITTLHALVVTARDNDARLIHQDAPDGNAAFAPAIFCLLDCGVESEPREIGINVHVIHDASDFLEDG